MSDRPLILIIRHAHGEPEVVYNEDDVDVWFADSTFAPNHYSSVQAQTDDIVDLAEEAERRGEADIARRLWTLAAAPPPRHEHEFTTTASGVVACRCGALRRTHIIGPSD